MNKQPNNNDFQDLFQIYTESCGYKKEEKKDVEEEEEELATEEAEEAEEAEENPEETDDVQQEGLFDRLKAKAAGVKGTAGAYASGVKSAIAGKGAESVEGKYGGEKTKSILKSHLKKFHSALSNLVTDVARLEVMDADTAEKLADDVYKKVEGQLFMKSNLQKRDDIDVEKKGYYNRDKGDAAARFQPSSKKKTN